MGKKIHSVDRQLRLTHINFHFRPTHGIKYTFLHAVHMVIIEMQLKKTDKAKLKGSDEKITTRAARVAVRAIRDHLGFALLSVTIRITRDQLVMYGRPKKIRTYLVLYEIRAV